MHNLRRLLLGLAAVGALAGCINSADMPMDRRWAELEPHGHATDMNSKPAAAFPLNSPVLVPEDPQADDIPQLWISSNPAPSTVSNQPLGLSDLTGAAFIKALGKLETDPAALSKDVGNAQGPQSSKIDTTKLDRMLVITVAKGGYHPADRIVQTKITITPENFSFANFTAAATAYTTVNLDNISSTRAISGTAGLAPGAASAVFAAPSLSATAGKSTVDAFQVTQQIEPLSVWREGDNLVVYREGERGIELSGVTVIKLSFAPDKEKGSTLDENLLVTDFSILDKNGTNLPPDKASVTLGSAEIWKAPSCGLRAKATLHYVTRQVIKGQETTIESDDTVRFVTNPSVEATHDDFQLVTEKEMEVPRWQVVLKSDPTLPVAIQADNVIRTLIFPDYMQAQKFAHWMMEKSATKIGSLPLGVVDAGTNTNILRSLSTGGSYAELIVMRLK